MKGGGTIIRLIDIVMILLLGFLSISDIVHKKEIKLPSGKKKPTNTRKHQLTRIRIQVIESDTTIDSLRMAPPKEKSQEFLVYKILEDERAKRVRNLDLLSDEFGRLKSSYDSLLIIINPDSNSIVQGTINLIDLCRRYQLKRMFDYPD